MAATNKNNTVRIELFYSIASLAKMKLRVAADEADHDLRLLVGHANFLDELMDALHNSKLSDANRNAFVVKPLETSKYHLDDDDDDDDDSLTIWSDEESDSDEEDLSLEEFGEPSEGCYCSMNGEDKTSLTLKPSPTASTSLNQTRNLPTTRTTTTELHTNQLGRPARLSFNPILHSIKESEEVSEEEVKELLDGVEASLVAANMSDVASTKCNARSTHTLPSNMMRPAPMISLPRPQTPVLAAAS